ncbi:uncharacterized protein LOC122268148 [Penaeus japonicus]|uniref:uncharacterized protein LOC122268148 n=1 Tax=Penaeus japonicus TaxID=27405 RepID=UPI001C70FA9E|nr:uncharacterized protein LOC122268148 [Penaeus japonicus]
MFKDQRALSSPSEGSTGSNVTGNGSPEVTGGASDDPRGCPVGNGLEERIVQISTPTHPEELLACVRKLRHKVSTADVRIVVNTEVFHAHRFLVTHFSKFFARALQPKKGGESSGPSNVVFVEEVEADIMAYLLDFMYGNLSILKESKLLQFLRAARWLEVDCLQTPGLENLERNLTKGASASPSGGAFSDGQDTEGKAAAGGGGGGGREGCGSRNILLPNFRFPSSVEFIPRNFGSCDATTCRGQAWKNGIFGENSAVKEQSKCCRCCHCSCKREGCGRESSQVKEESNKGPDEKKEAGDQEEDETQSLMKKLKKCGTNISGNTLSMLHVPAWLFSSKNISITPVKDHPKSEDVSTADESTANKESLAPKEKPESDAPVIVGTSTPKPGPTSSRRNLMPALQAPPQPQRNAYSPRGGHLRHPGPRGSYPTPQRHPTRGFIAQNRHTGSRVYHVPSNRRQVPYPRQVPSDVPGRVRMTQSNRGRGYVTSSPLKSASTVLDTPRNQNTPSPDARNVQYLDQKLNQELRVILNEILPPRSMFTHVYTGRGWRGRLGRGRGRPQYLPPPVLPPSENEMQQAGGSQDHVKNLMDGGSQDHVKNLMDGGSQDHVKNLMDGGSQDHVKNLMDGGNQYSRQSNTIYWDGNEPFEVRDTGITIQLADSAAELIAGATVLSPAAPPALGDERSFDLLLTQPGSPHHVPVTPTTNGTTTVAPSSEPAVDSVNADVATGEKSSSFAGFSGDVDDAASQVPPQPPEGPGEDVSDGGPQGEQSARDENCSDARSTKTDKRKKRGGMQKTFRCPVCRMMFKNNCALIMHQRQHAGERPRYCSSCPFRTEFLASMKTHVKRKHGRISLLESEKVCHPAPEVNPRSWNKRRKSKEGKVEGQERKEELKAEEGEKEEEKEEEEEETVGQGREGGGESRRKRNGDKGGIPDGDKTNLDSTTRCSSTENEVKMETENDNL